MPQAIVWNHVSLGHHPPDGNLELLPEYIDLDFIHSLYKDENILYGLKISVVYYENWDEQNDIYSNPAARVIWKTEFDNSKNPPSPHKQIQKVSWKLVNGKWSEEKVKIIPIRKPKVFLQKMRSRVIEELVGLANKFGFKSQILQLYETYQSEVILYEKAGSSKFRSSIQNSTEKWLDVVTPGSDNRPRDVLVRYLSIGVVEN